MRLAILDEAPNLPVADMPDAVNQLLPRALSKDPDERPATAQAFLDELSAATLAA